MSELSQEANDVALFTAKDAHAGTWRTVQSYVIRGEEVRMTEGVVMGPEFIDPWACRPAGRKKA